MRLRVPYAERMLGALSCVWRGASAVCCAVVLCVIGASGQSNTGELRLSVVDPDNLGVQSSVSILSEANQFHQTYSTDAAGTLTARNLPFGVYRLEIARQGFADYSSTLEIRSAIPASLRVQLSLPALRSSVEVKDSATLVDPHRPGSSNRIGPETIEESPIAPTGRSAVDLVASQPGWLFESNGVLHPRGSEYQTQFVVNGVPLTDNRSAAFAPQIDTEDVNSMTILTAGFPAEYGRKLGGVVEVATTQNSRRGLHGEFAASGGSFGSMVGDLSVQYGWKKTTIGGGIDGALTDRYLDPPVLENFTNHASTTGFNGRVDRDLSDRDRLGIAIRHDLAVFQVPNEQVQEIAGQAQDRSTQETMGILSYEHIFSPNALGDIRVMSRDDSSGLASNALSTPIIASQQRSFREGYLKANFSLHHGVHEIKLGGEFDYGSIHEQFASVITDPTQFDASTPKNFNFLGAGVDREQSLYAQDLIRLGKWTLSAGLRFDHYQLIVEQSAVSPRVGVAYAPGRDIVLHFSYDRIFQTPAFENILLASSPSVQALDSSVLRLPVKPSHGNFYEAGVTKGIAKRLKLDLNYYDRLFNNYADDDLLLNTGVSFPIAFRRGEIYGAEAKVEIPRWGRFSGYASYSYMVGFAYTPVTGGLFFGSDANTVLTDTGRFPVSQDQRNTVTARGHYQATSRVWAAFGGTYGSGLPTGFDGTLQQAVQQFGEVIVSRVDFARGRVRPSLALDASVGADILRRDRIKVRAQADLENINDRVNVINFAGLFSGTGVAPPRAWAARLETQF